MTAPWDEQPEEIRPEYVETPDASPAAVSSWSWDGNKLVIVALGIVGAGFLIYFILQYTSAKRKFEETPTDG
jgi:hypothetical protein